MIFYDDHSTDGTREAIQACPKAILRDWPGEPGIVDDRFLDFANTQWREAIGQAEWVAWVDADEFLYHPDMLNLLARYLEQHVSVPLIDGYTMIADHFPTTTGQIYDEVRTGFPDNCWCKPAIFRDDMKWTMGRHGLDDAQFKPKRSEKPEIKMLHYRCLGIDYLRERHHRNWSRVPQRCRELNLGTNCYPGHDGHHGVAWFETMLKTKWPNVI